MICTPEFSSQVRNAARKSKSASNNDVKILCLGEAEGCENLFNLLEGIDENDAMDPVEMDDVDNDNLIVFWSSGTTGN